MKISEDGKDFIMRREACLLKPTWDAIGRVWNIGYGHVFKPGEPREPITQEEAVALFEVDVLYREDAVNDFVHAELLQRQFDALVSFCYNVGTMAFSTSTLVQAVNAQSYMKAGLEFLRWNKSNGRKVRGLCVRRYEEALLFTFGDYTPC